MRRRTFAQYASPMPTPRGIDVFTTLRHFALVTYAVEPGAVKSMVPARLSPLTIVLNGESRALVSVVLFVNTRFRSAVFPSPSLNMAQINYRAYVIDRETGEHGIWFIQTLIDSWAFLVPRYVWHMPWRRASISLKFEANRPAENLGDEQRDRVVYKTYDVTAVAGPASSRVALAQEPDRPLPLELPGFPDVETGLVCLTHAFSGFYRRRDGKIAVNRVWHEPIPVTPARLTHASFPLLERLNLVPPAEMTQPYSVLLAPAADFMSRLPPTVLRDFLSPA